MTDVRALVQAALDAFFNGEVCVFWQRRAENGGENQDEYIVYTLGGDNELSSTDDKQIITKEADITVRYYYRYEMIDTSAGRKKVAERENQIIDALKNAGFLCRGGAFDAGDVDDAGCFTSVIECNYWRAV